MYVCGIIILTMKLTINWLPAAANSDVYCFNREKTALEMEQLLEQLQYNLASHYVSTLCALFVVISKLDAHMKISLLP